MRNMHNIFLICNLSQKDFFFSLNKNGFFIKSQSSHIIVHYYRENIEYDSCLVNILLQHFVYIINQDQK